MPYCAAEARQRSHRDVWEKKPVLREIYGHLYRNIIRECHAGLTVEVGGGSGNFKQFAPEALSLDIVYEPWVDLVADAQALPLRDESVANIVMLDVLHHIEFPIRFFREAARVLQPSGRIVCMEPGITPLSGLAYRAMHEEPVDMSIDPCVDGQPDLDKDPYVGNQAVPTLLAGRYADQLAQIVPGLSLISQRRLSLLAYPLSGGFKRWSLVTPRAARVLLRFEDKLEGILGWVCGFRLMMVYEKHNGTS